MLNHFLNLLNLGYSVIPLKPKSKEPLIPWKEFQSRKATETEIRGWIATHANVNIGIVTGTISGIAIVDLDGPDGLKSTASLGLASPLVSLTGNGKQLWYRYSTLDANVGNAVKLKPGLDIRGEGGYVVAPPSIHPNGKRYRFNRPVCRAESLPPFPVSIFAQDAASPITTSAVRKEKLNVAKALEEMTIGNIDNTLVSVLGRMRNDNWTAEEALVFLRPHAERAGATPGHLEAKIENVWGRYEPKQRTMQQSQSHSIGVSQHLVLHSPANPDSINEFQLRTNNAHDGIRTGYEKFDTLTKGLKKGEVLTVAARTGVGKTNWIITPIRNFCQQSKKVLLFSTEMSFDQIWSRYKQTLERDGEFESHQLFICDEFTPDIARIEEAIKNVTPDLFVFDHISHIGTDYHIISKFMSEIKRLARHYGIPAIVTAQLNRHADYVEQGERIEPRLSMIQGSDQIGQMSAQVLLLNEKRINGDVTEIEGIVVKNRWGDKGMVSFGLIKNPYRMIEL